MLSLKGVVNMDSSRQEHTRQSKSESYMAIGASLGIPFGLLLFDGNIAFGLVTGMLLGLSLGSIHDQLDHTPRNSYFGMAAGGAIGLIVGILVGQTPLGFLLAIGASFGIAFGMIADTPGQTVAIPAMGAICGSILGALLGILAGLLHGWHARAIGYAHTYLISMPFIDDYVFAGAGMLAAIGIWLGMRINRKR
jgi:hypothetical protein